MADPDTGSRHPTTVPDAPAPRPVEVDPRPPIADLAARLRTRGVISETGGMGVITEVVDCNLLRACARKTLRVELGDDPDTVRRFIEEAQITAQLDHPGIVPVHEIGVDADGSLFFTMQRVQGRTLSALLAETPPARRTDKQLYALLQVMLKVCDAVAFAHSRGVVHQDLKPDNVMVGAFGEVFVMDWGVARLRAAEAPAAAPAPRNDDDEPAPWDLPRVELRIVGTPSYMAPEQAAGDAGRIDRRTDVFALGAILYEILTGRPPFEGPTPQAVLAEALFGEVEPPERKVELPIPVRLSRLTMKALAREPADRFATVAALREELEGFLQSAWQFPTRSFPAGERILREGDAGDAAYVVLRGRCRAFRGTDAGGETLEEIGPGEVFGEVAILTRQPRTASVEALEPVTVLEITRAYLEEEIGSNYWLTLFVRALARRFRGASAAQAAAARERDDARLAVRVLEHLVRAGGDGGDGRRTAPWKPLCAVLSGEFGRPAGELRGLVERAGPFRVDESRDRISLQ
ncbi:MAG: cyclic nucleotide-binding domain-containing protein [Deltaproteobacteria bacterium]|nr:cyclic nucleotide-binding domain-containing protein [Deltaproteobacteria bacterium]